MRIEQRQLSDSEDRFDFGVPPIAPPRPGYYDTPRPSDPQSPSFLHSLRLEYSYGYYSDDDDSTPRPGYESRLHHHFSSDYDYGTPRPDYESRIHRHFSSRYDYSPPRPDYGSRLHHRFSSRDDYKPPRPDDSPARPDDSPARPDDSPARPDFNPDLISQLRHLAASETSSAGGGNNTVAQDFETTSEPEGRANTVRVPVGEFHGVEIQGLFGGGNFMAVADADDTLVTFEKFPPSLIEGQEADPDLVNGIINQKFLRGDGSSEFKVTLEEGIADYRNVLGVYEIDASGNIVDPRILFENTNVDESAVAGIEGVDLGNRLGFFIVQNAADWAGTIADDDTLSFINSWSGETANIADYGSDVKIAVNGDVAWQTVFHSFSERMNSDGVQHSLSGVDPGGESIVVGFEDQTGGGDWDFQDVVFRVEVVDDFVPA